MWIKSTSTLLVCFLLLLGDVIFICHGLSESDGQDTEIVSISTMERLGILVKLKFEEIEGVHHHMYGLFRDLNRILDGINNRLDNMDLRLEGMNKSIYESMEETQNILQQKVQGIETEISNNNIEVVERLQGLDEYQSILYQKIQDVETDIRDSNIEHGYRWDALNQTLQTILESFTEERSLWKEALNQTCTRQELKSIKQSLTEVCVFGSRLLQKGENTSIDCQRMMCNGKEMVPVSGELDEGFTMVPNVGCIKRNYDGFTYDKATAYCSSLGARVVVPEDFGALQRYVVSIGYSFWVGVQGGVWLDGREVAPEEWGRSDRRGDLGDDSYCAFMNAFDQKIYDGPCSVNTFTFRLLCQLRK